MGQECAQWLGVGLEIAQKVGALPEGLTSSQKEARPRDARAKRIEVVRDEA